jgi:hypothetical protein
LRFPHASQCRLCGGQFDMPGVVLPYLRDQGRTPRQVSLCDRLARLLQQFRQNVLASFQRGGLVGLQIQDTLVKRQCGFHLAGSLRLGGAAHQVVRAAVNGFAFAQLQRHHFHRRTWNLQFARKGKRLAGLLETVGPHVFARLGDGCQPHTHQTFARFAAVCVQRLGSFEMLPCASAINRTQMALLEGTFGCVQLLLDTEVRPNHIGQRAAENDHGEHQAQQACGDPPPGTTVTRRRRGLRGAAELDIRPIDGGFYPAPGGWTGRPGKVLAGLVVRIVAGVANHPDRIIIQPERRASSTPGSASSLPSSIESWP